MNQSLKSLTSGLAGAVTLTAVHQLAQRFTPNAPRVDIVGKRALSKLMRKSGFEPPREKNLFTATMVGELVSNAIYYSLVGAGKAKGAWWQASLLGIGAGVGAVVLPPMFGLGRRPTQRTTATEIMTVAWYTTGALASAAVLRLLSERANGKVKRNR
jgi:hypothetical protein